MDYEQMLHSMLCRNCWTGAGWWDVVVSSSPDEDIGDEDRTPPMLCVETWYVDYEDETSDIVTREWYYHLWCKKCLPASLRQSTLLGEKL